MTRTRYVALILALPWLMAAVPNENPTVSADEEKQLTSGEVVVRQETTETGAVTVAIVDIDAPPQAAIAAVLDVKARVDEVGSIQEVTYYREEDEHLGVNFGLSVMGVAVNFSTMYVIDHNAHLAHYALDPDKENDVVKAEGFYQAFEHDGGSRLVYAGTSDSGRRVPAWVKRWMTNGAMNDQLQGIRTRAEAAK